MTARSYLYVPGDRPDMLAKAPTRGADALIADLEDGVAASAKADARREVAAWLGSVDPGCEVWVRVNSSYDELGADLEAVGTAASLTGVVLPKATGRAVASLPGRLRQGLRVIPLVETAAGLVEVGAIAASPLVQRIGLGEADLVADLGMRPSPDGRELAPIRTQVVVASAAAGLDSPVGPVETDIGDLEGLAESTAALERMGFGARSAIHPSQVSVINRVLTPDPEQVERARKLVESARRAAERGEGVFVDEDGRMVDEAVLRSARRLLARAGEQPDP